MSKTHHVSGSSGHYQQPSTRERSSHSRSEKTEDRTPRSRSDRYEPSHRTEQSDTWMTPKGTTVHRDRDGNTYYPDRSKITDVHESRSGKSIVRDHKDGIREIEDKRTGETRYQRIPERERQVERPKPPSSGSHSNHDGTWVTPGGTTVHRDRDGNITYPSRSKVTDIHESRSGKSVVIEHRDGIREIHNKETGHVTFARRPASEIDHHYIAPPTAPRRYYARHDINFNFITINETNIYLRDRGHYYYREPVFYSGYRWEPPVFSPILFTAGLALAALDTVYRPDYPRGTVTNMTGVNWYAGELHSAGIYDSFDLVRAGRTAEDREELARMTGMPYDEVRKAVGQADLMRVDGIGPHNSRLLVDAGITSMQDLARYSWDPESLYEQLRFSSFWDEQRAPSRREVASWIEQARLMPLAIYDDNR